LFSRCTRPPARKLRRRFTRAHREQKPYERVADAKVRYLKLTPEQVETQKRFGFASDNIKVKANVVHTHFTRSRHAGAPAAVPQSTTEVELETDPVFAKE